jgi:hypothetical protein
MRDSLLVQLCGIPDSATVILIHDQLQKVDTGRIDKNLHEYLKDVAWNYYLMFLHDKDSTNLQSSVAWYERARMIKPKDAQTLWNCAFDYALLSNCDKATAMLQQYLKVQKKKFIDDKQVNYLRERCPDATQADQSGFLIPFFTP